MTSEKKYGSLVGYCKWFNSNKKYGFIVVCSDCEHINKDVFFADLDIHPINSESKSLIKGEYVNFDIIHDGKGYKAINITGILGGPLLCDNNIGYSSTGRIIDFDYEKIN